MTRPCVHCDEPFDPYDDQPGDWDEQAQAHRSCIERNAEPDDPDYPWGILDIGAIEPRSADVYQPVL